MAKTKKAKFPDEILVVRETESNGESYLLAFDEPIPHHSISAAVRPLPVGLDDHDGEEVATYRLVKTAKVRVKVTLE